MACNCYFPKLVRASEVTTADGATTITLPSTVEPSPGEVMDIGLFTAIPVGTDGTTVTVTNGTLTGFVMAPNGNYFRPLPLTSRTILRVQWFDDPSHFQVLLPVRRSK
jgi:hypothetical protein